MPWEKIELKWTKSTKRNGDGRPLYRVSNCPSIEGAPPVYQFYAVPHGRRLFVLHDYLDREVIDCDNEGDTVTVRPMSLKDAKKTAQKVSDWEVRTENALEEQSKALNQVEKAIDRLEEEDNILRAAEGHATPADEGNEAAFRKAAEAEDGMPISAGARKAPQGDVKKVAQEVAQQVGDWATRQANKSEALLAEAQKAVDRVLEMDERNGPSPYLPTDPPSLPRGMGPRLKQSRPFRPTIIVAHQRSDDGQSDTGTGTLPPSQVLHPLDDPA